MTDNIDTSPEAVERLLDGVTPGPWREDGDAPWKLTIWSNADNRVCFMSHSNGLDDDRDFATARFIAAARQLVPALSAERDRLTAENAMLRGALSLVVRADTLREVYHALPNDKNRIGDKRSKKGHARDAWLRAFRKAAKAALAASQPRKTDTKGV